MLQRVFIDANVLYSRTLRDWTLLLRLTGAGGMFQLHSTHDVIAEAMYHLRKSNPLARGKVLHEVRTRIEQSLDEVVEDFDPKITFPGSDIHDRHVHAAAVACRADKLLTCDKGFLGLTDEVRDQLDYEIYSPDEFFLLIDDSNPMLVREVTEVQRAYWATQKRSGGLENALIKAGCPEFAAKVRGHLKALSGI